MPHYPGHIPFVAEAASGFSDIDNLTIARVRSNPMLGKLSCQISQAYTAAKGDVNAILDHGRAFLREMELTLASAQAIVAKANADFPPPEPVPSDESKTPAPVKTKAQARQAGQA
jgi:hypothetical protein